MKNFEIFGFKSRHVNIFSLLLTATEIILDNSH